MSRPMLHVHRHQHVELLVRALAARMAETAPADPFRAVPVVVGSRGMERWLGTELATLEGATANVRYLFPRTAVESLSDALLAGRDPGDALSGGSEHGNDRYRGMALVLGVQAAFRKLWDRPELAAVRGYVAAGGAAGPDLVDDRELSFAEEVADCLSRLAYDRPDVARTWAADPSTAPGPHRWLALVLSEIGMHAPEAPPERLRRLVALRPRSGHVPALALHVFGLSTLRPGDLGWLHALSRHVDVHLYLLAPSSAWAGDIRTAGEKARALRRARSPRALDDATDELVRENALLSGNGRPSRDLQRWLEEVDYQEDELPGASPLASPATLLGRLQAFVDAAEENPAPGAFAHLAGCRSVQVHACHGALRQCEALRDALLDRFEADPTLEPRHVVVMTPDIATFGPLLAAVLGRHSPGVPEIPVHVADLGLRATNPVAQVLLQALALADERVNVSRVLELVSLPPFRERFGLPYAELDVVQELVQGSQMRWGWDSGDRRRHDQPPLDQNTVRFGLERLALGALMPDPGGTATVGGTTSDLPPAVPFDIEGRRRTALFGRLAEALRSLRAVASSLAEPRSLPEWKRDLRSALDLLTRSEGNLAWQRVEVEAALDERLVDGLDATGAVTRRAIVSLLAGAFDLPQRGDRPVTGAVTVCAMEPMRSVPFRIVAIVGMDDRGFPRTTRLPQWDPFAEPAEREHDRRTVDRHLFLEALLCARDAFLLFGTGFEALRGDRAPLSVVATELVELVARAVGRTPSEVRIDHPLQPWSRAAFAPGPARSFDPGWARAANAVVRPEALPQLGPDQLEPGRWPPEDRDARTLDVDAIVRALVEPSKEFVARRLRVRLEEDRLAWEDREPLQHDRLEEWKIRALLLPELVEQGNVDLDRLEARLRGEGVLAAGSIGRGTAEDACADAVAGVQALLEQVPDLRAEERTIAVDVAGVTVKTTAGLARDRDGQQVVLRVTASAAGGDKERVRASLVAALARAAGLPVQRVVVGGKELHVTDVPGDADEARQLLERMVAAYRDARHRPIPGFRTLSRKLVESARKHPGASDEELAVAAFRDTWRNANGKGVGDDPYVRVLFADLGEDDVRRLAPEMLAWARRVWDAVLPADAAAAAPSTGSAASDPDPGAPTPPASRTGRGRKKRGQS